MGRCVDASPLAVKEGLTPPTVFIGSHSGVFVSLCMLSGKCHWQTQLSDRAVMMAMSTVSNQTVGKFTGISN